MANENETEMATKSPLHKLNGGDPVYDAFSVNTSARSSNTDDLPATPFVQQVIFFLGFISYSG